MSVCFYKQRASDVRPSMDEKAKVDFGNRGFRTHYVHKNIFDTVIFDEINVVYGAWKVSQ